MSGTRQNWRVRRLGLHMALNAARLNAGLRQAEIARSIGCSLRNFQRMESGGAEPNADELFAWGAAVGVEIGFTIVGPQPSEVSV